MNGPADELHALHVAVDRDAARLETRHRERLRCRRGCADCCVDGITVFEVEAERIRAGHADLLREGRPHPEGACAFLGRDLECRIYPDRPYVCRTQGLPLRWTGSGPAGDAVEYRDICPLNDRGAPLTWLPAEECWSVGPWEGRLAELQRSRDRGAMRRVALRSLFARPGGR